MTLATPHQQRHNASVPFNSGAGFGDLIALADSRLYAAFFMSVLHAIGASISMAGRGGDTFGYAGSQCAGSPTPPRACHPRLATDGRPHIALEATYA